MCAASVRDEVDYKGTRMKAGIDGTVLTPEQGGGYRGTQNSQNSNFTLNTSAFCIKQQSDMACI